MDNLNKTFTNIIKVLVLHFIGFSIIGYFFRDIKLLNAMFGNTTYKAFIIGLTFGFLFSIMKIFLLKRTLITSLSMSKNKSSLYTNAHYFIRFIFTAIMLYVAITNPNIDFLGSLVGLLSLQSSSYIGGFLIKDDESLKLDNQVEELE